jgi:predicted aspartyl protease
MLKRKRAIHSLRRNARVKKGLCFVFVAGLFASVSSHLSYAQHKPAIVEVPFTFQHSSVIVQVKVGGKGPYNMLLDTGAEQSAIDLNTARELGLKLSPLGEGRVVAAGKKENTVFLTTLPQVEVSSVTAKGLLAAATDFSKISQRIGMPVNGVLGYNFLRNRIVEFDYGKRMVRFHSVSPFSPKQRAASARMTLPFHFSEDDRFPLIDNVYVNGKKITAELDTGHSGVLAVTAAAINRLGLEAEAEGCEAETSEGALGTSVNRKCKLRTLKVGTLTINSPTVSFRAPNSGLDEAPFEGLLGNDFFKDFVVTFDYRSLNVTFEKQPR